ncbi:hypothetical protein E2C01_094827 [Portunus trituberculatus]|uniref:Uncharacterized protein n=1 Tax=Portunus trituberculatus TaxID=210409 RepID=A0A5B7K474_PORTR|nr:hypothetical protein [Portunus trituberculatus]
MAYVTVVVAATLRCCTQDALGVMFLPSTKMVNRRMVETALSLLYVSYRTKHSLLPMAQGTLLLSYESAFCCCCC